MVLGSPVSCDGGRRAATHRALDLLEAGLAEYATKPTSDVRIPKPSSGKEDSP